MKLVYKSTGKPVAVGDRVSIDGYEYEVLSFDEPHKPAASGKVTLGVGPYTPVLLNRTFYVGVIGAEWVYREDRREGSAISEYLTAFDKLSLDTLVLSLNKLGYNKDEIHAAMREYIDSKI